MGIGISLGSIRKFIPDISTFLDLRRSSIGWKLNTLNSGKISILLRLKIIFLETRRAYLQSNQDKRMVYFAILIRDIHDLKPK
jgi:hypothetical protein